MSTYTGVNQFPDVYKLAVSDPVTGGATGVANLQAKNIADRTAYIRSRFVLDHLDTGEHPTWAMLIPLTNMLQNIHFAAAANIAETKLSLTIAGKPRPSNRGVYSTTLQLATDIIDICTGVSGTSEAIAAYVHSSQLDPHNSDATAHKVLLSWANNLLLFGTQMEKTILYQKLFKHCIGAYTGGFVTTCADSTDLGAGSANYTFGLEGTFRPTASGATMRFPTPTGLSLSSNPLSSKIVLAVEPVSSLSAVTAGLTVSASKNSGTTWTPGTLSTTEQYGSGRYFMSWLASSLPATDTRNLAIKIVSTAGTDFKIHAAACFV